MKKALIAALLTLACGPAEEAEVSTEELTTLSFASPYGTSLVTVVVGNNGSPPGVPYVVYQKQSTKECTFHPLGTYQGMTGTADITASPGADLVYVAGNPDRSVACSDGQTYFFTTPDQTNASGSWQRIILRASGGSDYVRCNRYSDCYGGSGNDVIEVRDVVPGTSPPKTRVFADSGNDKVVATSGVTNPTALEVSLGDGDDCGQFFNPPASLVCGGGSDRATHAGDFCETRVSSCP